MMNDACRCVKRRERQSTLPGRMTAVTGRFAPSPTGPLHLGSLVAAVGSWLFARAAGARWLVRMEDLDTPRVRPGSADEILRALERYALQWDGEVVYQSMRHPFYEAALAELRERGRVYDCGCTRAELQRTASAPATGDPGEGLVYPGTCRSGLAPGKQKRAVRFRVTDETIAFRDLIRGDVAENVAHSTGDFVVRRADGIWAYQLAVVVDDELQGVTQVVRGGDLLGSTARQIALQRALGYREPAYGHLPLVVEADGSKLGKRGGALPLPDLDERRVGETLATACRILGCGEVPHDRPALMLAEALRRFEGAALARVPQIVSANGLV
jgi:glutamyl-Q tRNA(Asp) synthetase